MKELDVVFDYIDEHFDEHVRRVQKYLRRPSISHTGEGIMEGAKLTMSYLEALGAETAISSQRSLRQSARP